MSDHGSTILLPALLQRLRKEAPQSELVVSATGPQTYDEPHVMILTADGHQAMVDQPLAALGLKRRVALRIPFFIPAVLAITETDLVLTVPRTLATITARLAGLRKVEPPREIRPFPYFMSWHSRLTNEADIAVLKIR